MEGQIIVHRGEILRAKHEANHIAMIIRAREQTP